jgi:hypothetical protein
VPEFASYHGGSFIVPGSTGNFSITDLDFRPQLVLFFGSNKDTYDSVVTAGHSAVMRGTMVQDDVTDSIVAWCSSAVPHDSMRWEQKPIVCCLDGGSGTDYQANAVSIDAAGFTLNFTVVSAGSRRVHYVAIGEMSHSFAKIIGSNFGGTSASVDVGWRPQSGLALGGLDDTVQDVGGPNREQSTWGHMLSWGGKSFRTDNISNHVSMFLNATDTPFNDQDQLRVERYSGATSYIGFGQHFVGPFMNEGAYQMVLSGTGLTTVGISINPSNQCHFTGLSVESDTGNANTAAALDGEITITSSNPDVEAPALLLFLGACGRESGANGNPNAMSFGFWTEDHSYCVAANGFDDSFFQSEQYAWCSKVTASGAHAGTAASNAPEEVGATLRTEVADITPARLVWHMFGPELPEEAPRIYRHGIRYRL